MTVDAISDRQLIDTINAELFDESEDSVEEYAERKNAVANPLRASILHLLHTRGEVLRRDLVEATGRQDNHLQHHMKILHDAGLIEKDKHPDHGRLVVYRITDLGESELFTTNESPEP